MRIFHTKKMMFVLFVLGFLIGILYVNLASGQFAADSGVFSDYFLNQYASVTIHTEEYVIYLMGVRLVPFLIMVGLSFTKMRKFSAYIFLVWTGFSGGMLLSMAAYSMGSRGILLCIAAVSYTHLDVYKRQVQSWCRRTRVYFSDAGGRRNRRSQVFSAERFGSGSL